MKKQGMVLSKIVKIAVLIIMLILLVTIFFDRTYLDDITDWVNNLFQPPEIDPGRTQREQFEARQDALNMLRAWEVAYDRALNSNERACFEELPTMPESAIKEGYVLQIGTNERNKQVMQIAIKTDDGYFPISERHPINTGLCMVVDKEKDMLERFYKNLIKKYNPDGCTLTEPCANHFLSGVGSYQLTDLMDEEYSFENVLLIGGGAVFQTPSPDEKKGTTMQIVHVESINNQPEEKINTEMKRLSENEAFRLIKINDNVCILPIENSWNRDYVKRDGFFYFGEELLVHDTDYTGLLPRCQKTENLRDYISEPIYIQYVDVPRGVFGIAYNKQYYTVQINYENQQWNIKYRDAHKTQEISFISDMLAKVQNKNYVEGVKTLCDEYPLFADIPVTYRDRAGGSRTISRIQGLRCDLVNRDGPPIEIPPGGGTYP